MPWEPDVETNLAISSANHLKVRFIQQSPWGPDVETNLAIRSANHLKVRFIQQSHGDLMLKRI
ncbi:hypothetical protein E3U36_10795 [Arsenophonus endosymbiont of Aphis craccivora]|uniref:hypothetical protein n=1 Tax=Arsenophonus endosymbiont of Aphis craccivora TaxID=1231049 RepID=UPI0015DC8EF1|nr:hypothetical protein [Arsenophonus endosymbiont of Aphis craccivora]QLK88409.1 hypothetical protein E3U36_10795 [Arsenophonus endosymbiont of Aphis craccivora]